MALLETVDLCQRHGEYEVLRNVNLKVERGESFALIGPKGAGKTTLLRLLDLLDSPCSGKIVFDGADVTECAKDRFEARRRMGFVLQKPVVFNASVYENVACGLKWRGTKSLRQKVMGVLELCDFLSYRNRNARTLSGGEAQIVAIARAIVSGPEVLLLDEPTANLDPHSVARVEELIANIMHRHETSVVMATHDMSQGQRLADRVGVLLNGEIAQAGEWSEVLNCPRSKEVANFVGTQNIIGGVIVAAEDRVVGVAVGDKVIEAISDYAVAEKVYVCIRPEDITIALSRSPSSARNFFKGEIRRVVTSGPLSRIEMDCGFPLVALVTKKSAEGMGLEKGKQVCATFKATGVHVMKREGEE
ncbi:MAG: ABC transporter ATP-binding protein [Chloroflexi bacterium]|nr:ABC transporter ATP-binding protein [Chloroflexota bacterium]